MPSNKLDLTIIILNFNGQFWLKKTLETLKEHYLKHTQRQVKVVVVDNHSSDDSVTMIKRSFRWVELIELAENIGFAAGNNVALKQVTSTYVMLLNSDVESTDQSNLDVLMNYLDQHSQVGVITPRLELANGQLDWACHRGEVTPWSGFTYYAKLEKLFPYSPTFAEYHQTYKDLDTIHAVAACSGAAMMVRTAAMKQVGVLDELFFFYAEDLDWCKRFREAGYEVVYNPGVKMVHHKYKSGMQQQATHIKRKTNHYFYDTMLQYYDKHHQDQYPQFVRTIIKWFITLKKRGV